MPLLPAVSSHHSGSTGTLILLIALAAVYYVIHNLIWPFRSCRNCQGLGRFRSPSGGSWRYCRKCGGRGAQVRMGRRIWSWWTRTKDRGNR